MFDDDPGIMSEVETSSTGFRRGGKQRSSLPVVRTPSKTLERPLGLVFLQYRNETKRALLPNEITSIDTVKALFVRSFPKQLTMEYLDSPIVKIYIHDSSKDMFYELEDLRSHLRDIRDRSVLRLFESDVNGSAVPMWDQDQSYFSEPEFDSEYQHQHIHKTKAVKKGMVPSPQTPEYWRGDRLHAESGYMSSPERGRPYPPYPSGSYEDPYYSQYGSRSGSITPVIDEEASDTEVLEDSYNLYGIKMSSRPPQNRQFPGVPYDATRIRVEHMERQLANLTGLVQKALTQGRPVPGREMVDNAAREYLQVPGPRDAYRNADEYDKQSSSSSASLPDESYLRPDSKPPKLGKERDRHKPAPPPKPVSLSPGQYEGRHLYRDLHLTPEMYNQLRVLQKKAKDLRQEVRNLRRMSQAQAHTVRETIRDTFIKIRAMLLTGGDNWLQQGDSDKVRVNREEELYKQEMIRLEKDLTELESTVEELRGNVINRKTRVNMSDVENMALILSKSSKTVADLKVRFPNLQDGMKNILASEMEKVVREEKFLKEEPERLESALRRCKKLTGTLVTLKRLASVQEQRLPSNNSSIESRLSPTLQDAAAPAGTQPGQQSKSATLPARGVMATTSSGDSYRQRPENALDALLDELQTFARPPSEAGSRKSSIDGSTGLGTVGTGTLRRLHSYPSSDSISSPVRTPSGAPGAGQLTVSRLQVSDPSGKQSVSLSPTPTSSPIPPEGKSSPIPPKPAVPERSTDLSRKVPPPPPPRTSSRSPLVSPTSPPSPHVSRPGSSATLPRGGLQHSSGLVAGSAATLGRPGPTHDPYDFGGTLRRGAPGRSSLREPLRSLDRPEPGKGSMMHSEENLRRDQLSSNSSSSESVNSQEGLQMKMQEMRAQSILKGTDLDRLGPAGTPPLPPSRSRQEVLEQRHQELLRKQKQLQEQYARLQQLQRGTVRLAPVNDLKKTGSESNILAKMGLNLSAAPMSGSLTHLAPMTAVTISFTTTATETKSDSSSTTTTSATITTTTTTTSTGTTTSSKIYETDIL